MKKKLNTLLRSRKKMSNIDAPSRKKKNSNTMAVHCTYEVRWKNFKGFVDTGWIKIKPITILIGNNNSGKTSFLAPFLLMNQTLSSRDSTSPLVIKGDLYDGGNFKELINCYDTNQDMFFGFRYHIHSPSGKLKKVGTYPPGAFEVTIGKKKGTNEIIVKKEAIYDMHLQEYLSISKTTDDKYKISGLTLSEAETSVLKNISPVNFLFTPNTILSAFEQLAKGEKNDKEENPKKVRFSKGYEELLRAVSRNFSDARDTLLDLSYLGPLREIPHRYYEIHNEDQTTVGNRGQNTPTLLKKYLKKIQKELNTWVKNFEFGDEVVLKDLSDEFLYEICFKNTALKTETNIANTGFGASQVLPLIVQALVSRKEDITIAEQPEIHLNPRLQGVLGDLFAYMANKDQRVIVETHSDHLLMRLRRLVANGTILPENIAVYFIEKKDNVSNIREINIDKNGGIPSDEWPSGFFGETLKESLALAVQQAKNRKN